MASVLFALVAVIAFAVWARNVRRRILGMEEIIGELSADLIAAQAMLGRVAAERNALSAELGEVLAEAREPNEWERNVQEIFRSAGLERAPTEKRPHHLKLIEGGLGGGAAGMGVLAIARNHPVETTLAVAGALGLTLLLPFILRPEPPERIAEPPFGPGTAAPRSPSPTVSPPGRTPEPTPTGTMQPSQSPTPTSAAMPTGTVRPTLAVPESTDTSPAPAPTKPPEPEPTPTIPPSPTHTPQPTPTIPQPDQPCLLALGIELPGGLDAYVLLLCEQLPAPLA